MAGPLPHGPEVLDALFQRMCAHGLAPREAQRRILEDLKLEKLVIIAHVAVGAWSLQPRHYATREEEEQAAQALRAAIKKYDLDAQSAIVYKRSPSPDGIIGPIEPESWGVTVTIAIRDGHLIIEPLVPEFPPESYTFAIATPEAVDKLLATASAKEPAPGELLTLRERKRKRRAPQVELADELMAMVFPQDGWHGMTPAAVRHKCDGDRQVKAKLRKEEKALPSTESFDRAMKRASARRR